MIQNKVVRNAKWIVICKIAQSLVQMIVGMLSARYLGPSNYGLISYASSIVAFAVPIMQLGLKETLVQEYVANPSQSGKIMGTALVMNIVAGIACVVGVTAFSMAANPEEPTTICVCVLYSLSLLFQSVELLQYWFQANLLSKYSSLAMLAAHIVVSVYKVILLAGKKNVYWFALSHSVEYCAVGFILLVAYKRLSISRIAFSSTIGQEILSRSKHYIMANLMVILFQNVSQVLLKLFSGSSENGFYATAVTCISITAFIFMAIIDSMRPVILESRKQSVKKFENNVSRLYSMVIYLTLAQSVCYTVLAKPIVYFLYGQDFQAAVPVLRIMVWQLAFSYMGTIRNIWILGEEKYDILWRINSVGVLVNVIMNLLFIPKWNACGAALASVLTQIFTNFVMGFYMKPIRRNNELLMKGLDPRCALALLSELKIKS